MSTFTKEQLARLPKWAIEEIDDRGRIIARLKEEVAALRDKPGKTDFLYRLPTEIDRQKRVPIPDGATVFIPIETRYKDDFIMIDRHDKRAIRVATYYSSQILIEPQAGNSVLIVPKKD